MSDVPTPAGPPHPKAVAKGLAGKLKGRKPLVYGLMAVGVIAIAYYMRKRSAAAALVSGGDASAVAPPQDYPGIDTSNMAGGVGDGAYGGFSDPTSFFTPFTDALGNFLTAQSAQQAGAQQAQSDALAAQNTALQSFLSALPTGGGAPAPVPVESHYTPPAPPAATPHPAPKSPASKLPTFSPSFVTGTTAHLGAAPTAKCPAKFPFLNGSFPSADTCYQVDTNRKKKGDRWHIYQSGRAVKV